jgi:hypothetical protein
MSIKKVNITEKILYTNPRIRIIRDVFNITRFYDYVKYMEIYISDNTKIFINEDGTYLGLISKCDENSECSHVKLQVNIYKLPDMIPESETITPFDNNISAADISFYDIKWDKIGPNYKLVRNNLANTIHDPKNKELYLKLNSDTIYWPGYNEYYIKTYKKSFTKLYWHLNYKTDKTSNNSLTEPETAIPIGRATKYKYKIYDTAIKIFVRKDYVITDNYEYINKAINLDENTYIPIELCEVVTSYMSPETIIDIVNKLK